MATEGQRTGLERLAAGQTVAMAMAIHASMVTWVEFWAPSTTGPGVLSAVAWAVTEHPGRCAVTATLIGWGLWRPDPRGNAGQRSPSVDPVVGSMDPDVGSVNIDVGSADTDAGVDEPIVS